ncbi:hypothetical protein V2W45_1466562 [Cenococcum geophilum]
MASPATTCLFSNPLLEHPEALTRIQLLVLRLLNIIKDLPTKEIGEFADKFKDFKAELRLLPKGAPFKVPLKARWQPPPKKKHGKANQRGKTSAEIAKRAADVAIQEFQKERQEEARNIDLSHFLIQNEEPADEVDKDIEEDKEDKQQPFDKPLVLYNEVLGGLKDEVVILKTGEDDNSWLNNAEYLTIIKSRHLSCSINLVEWRALELKGPTLN